MGDKRLMSLDCLLKNNNESYYWAGFLMADGHIMHDRNKIMLSVSKKDKDHMIRFCKFIGSNLSNNESSYKTSKADVELVPLIINKYCFNDMKTYNPPEELKIKNNDLFISFLIGYLDGDGYISNVKNIGVECNSGWKKCLDKWFERVWHLAGCKQDHGTHKIPSAKIRQCRGGFSKSKTCVIQTCNSRFVNFLKKKSIDLNIPCLQRKWSRI